MRDLKVAVIAYGLAGAGIAALVIANRELQQDRVRTQATERAAETQRGFADLVYAIEASHEKCRSVAETVDSQWEIFGATYVGLILDRLRESDPDFAGAAEGLRQVEARLEGARHAPEAQRGLALDLFTIQKRECGLALSPEGNLLTYRSVRSQYAEEFDRKMTRLKFEAKLSAPGPGDLASFRKGVAAAEAAVTRQEAATVQQP